MTGTRARQIIADMDVSIFRAIECAIRQELAGTTGVICGNDWNFTQDLTDRNAPSLGYCQALLNLWHQQLYRHFRGQGVAQPAIRAQEALTVVMFCFRRDGTSDIDLFTFQVPELRPSLQAQRQEAARRKVENLAGADRAAMLEAVAKPYKQIFIEAGYMHEDETIALVFEGAPDKLETALIKNVFGMREGLMRELTRAIQEFSFPALNCELLNRSGFLDS